MTPSLFSNCFFTAPFVIVSYNASYLQQKSIESIRDTVPEGTYFIYVTDNGSTDGVIDYLKKQDDIHLTVNEENMGFAVGCNQCVKMMEEYGDEDLDIFLLNNDTRLAMDSLFWLKMALYSDDRIGCTGSVSNYAGNGQQLDVEFDLPQRYLDYACTVNIPGKDFFEERVRLSGFALLIRHGLWQQAGGMDEAFTPGYFEDDDLCVKISKLGYRHLLCHNSFIYHAGSQSFAQREDVNELLQAHWRLFIEKYGFDIINEARIHTDELSQIFVSADAEITVLNVGCGLGADMKYIRYLCPGVNTFGIEKCQEIYTVVQHSENVFASVEHMLNSIGQLRFDVLILSKERSGEYSEAELDLIASVCRSDTKVIIC